MVPTPTLTAVPRRAGGQRISIVYLFDYTYGLVTGPVTTGLASEIMGGKLGT